MIRLDIRVQVAAILTAADKVCREQTPPLGGNAEHYKCPACGATRSIRAELRQHLTMCSLFRRSALTMQPKLSTLIS